MESPEIEMSPIDGANPYAGTLVNSTVDFQPDQINQRGSGGYTLYSATP